MRFFGLLPAQSADHSSDLNFGRSATFRLFFLPLDRHAGGAATVLPPLHAALACLLPPPIF